MKKMLLWLSAGIGLVVLGAFAVQILLGVLSLAVVIGVACVFMYGLFKLTFRRRRKP